MIKKSSSIKKIHPTKIVNQGNPGYPSKPTNMLTFYKGKIKRNKL
jgi:hypothetical protein